MKVVCVRPDLGKQSFGPPCPNPPPLVKDAVYTVEQVVQNQHGTFYVLAEIPPQEFIYTYHCSRFVPLDYWNDEFNVKEDVDESLPVYKPVVRPALVPA